MFGTAVAAVALAAAAFAPAASAGSAPFDDQNASGYIGFCDRSGHQVRSGQIGAAPFAFHAVSSQPAPTGYTKATLYLYQPRREVDPGDWSGKQMTAAATFTNPAHPMAAGTGFDPAFVDFSGAYPLKWDGYAQARIFYTTPGRPMASRPYPAAILKVSGDTWTQIGGGDVPCGAGTSNSVELKALPSSILARPTARAVPGEPTSAASAAGASGGRSAPGGTSSRRGSGSAGSPVDPSASGSALPAADGSPVAEATSSNGSSAGSVWTTLIVVVAGAAAATVAVVRRRRRAG